MLPEAISDGGDVAGIASCRAASGRAEIPNPQVGKPDRCEAPRAMVGHTPKTAYGADDHEHTSAKSLSSMTQKSVKLRKSSDKLRNTAKDPKIPKEPKVKKVQFYGFELRAFAVGASSDLSLYHRAHFDM